MAPEIIPVDHSYLSYLEAFYSEINDETKKYNTWHLLFSVV